MAVDVMQICTKYGDRLYAAAFNICRQRQDAEDAVQEAFASLWERLPDVSVEKGKSYLLTVAHNYLMSRHRHAQVHQQAASFLVEEEVVNPDERFDLQEALHKALERLPQVQRAAVELKDVEGYSCKEIAQMLHLTEKQVTVYLFRARVSLKKTLIALGYDNNNR